MEPPGSAEVARAAGAALGSEIAEVTPIDEGLNAVYRVETAAGERAVLKAATLADDAELLAEARILRRLGEGTPVPVPAVLATVPAGSGPLDVAAFLTRYVEGRTVPDLLELPEAARERLVRESGRHLAAIHGLRPVEGFGPLRVVDGGLVADPARERWSDRFRELGAAAVAGLRGEGYTNDERARFADLADPVRDALVAEGVDDRDDVAPATLYGDYRPANLVLGPDAADPLVRAVVDLGGCETGHALLDLVATEDALVDVPLGGTGAADRLRRAFRRGYRDVRPGVEDPGADSRYPRYRLYARSKRLGAFDYWRRFAREDDPDAVAARWRSFVRDRLAALR